MKLREIKLEECIVKATPEEEDLHWTDKALGYEPEVCAAFEQMEEKHGLWGWCFVRVTVSWPPLPECVGGANLGCCSYESEADFRKSDYFSDLVREALADLNQNVKEALEEAEAARKLLEVEV